MHKRNFSVLATHTRACLRSQFSRYCVHNNNGKIREKNLLSIALLIQWIGQISGGNFFFFKSNNKEKQTTKPNVHWEPKITNELQPMCEIELSQWLTVFVDFNRSNKDWWLNYFIDPSIISMSMSTVLCSFVRSLMPNFWATPFFSFLNYLILFCFVFQRLSAQLTICAAPWCTFSF